MKESFNGENNYPMGKFCLISLVSLDDMHTDTYVFSCPNKKLYTYTQTDI